MSFSKARRRFAAKRTPDSTGLVHASEGQAHWFDRLRMRERAGEISDLTPEPSYRIEIDGEWVCNVKADASFVEDGRLRVLDYKGVEGDTAVSRLKRRLVAAQHKVEIEIVGPAAEKKKRDAQKRAWAKVAADPQKQKPPRERTATASNHKRQKSSSNVRS